MIASGRAAGEPFACATKIPEGAASFAIVRINLDRMREAPRHQRGRRQTAPAGS
jgi:hypothetical protein